MSNAHESNEDRLARRRARRWERRMRLFAPFLAVPGMLVVLMLSVNLIEHRPDPGSRGTASDGTRPAASRANATGTARARTASAAGAPSAPGAPGAPGEKTPSGVAAAQIDGPALSAEAVIATAVGADMPLSTGEAAGTASALFDAPAPTAIAPGGTPAR